MSRDYRYNTRWCLSAGPTGCPVDRVKVDEIDNELDQIARHKFKATEDNTTNYLTEKFNNLKVGEPPNTREEFSLSLNLNEQPVEHLRSCETFTDVSLSGQNNLNRPVQQTRCTTSQSLSHLFTNKPENRHESVQSYSRFSNPSSSSDEYNNNNVVAMATEQGRIDDIMEEDISELSWNPAVLRRISSPRLSTESCHSDDYNMAEDFRLTASDSDSVSRVSFLLEENHVTRRNRKTQSMTNFLDLTSGTTSPVSEGELNMSSNNACDGVSCDEVSDDKLYATSPVHKSASYAGYSIHCSASYSSDAEFDVTTTSVTYQADVSDNVPSDEKEAACVNQTQSPVSTDSILDTPNEEKALTRNSLGRHDGDVMKDYQRSKSLDALRKRKRGRVAAFRQSAISVASHVFGVFRRVKATETGSRSPAKHKSPKKIREQKSVRSSPREQLFDIQNSSMMSTTSSSEYEIN